MNVNIHIFNMLDEYLFLYAFKDILISFILYENKVLFFKADVCSVFFFFRLLFNMFSFSLDSRCSEGGIIK